MTPDQERGLTLLMEASQRGDRQAYETLLQGLAPVIALYVRRRVPSPDLVDDVVQDVLTAIHRARHTWNPARPFMPWFYAVMQNRLIDAMRHRKRNQAAQAALEATAPAVWSSSSPEAEVVARTDLAQAMRQLTPAQRLVIERLKLQEMSVKDVARETGMSESHVKVTAHRGYAVLRKFLSGIGYGD